MRPLLLFAVCLSCTPKMNRYVFLPKTPETRKCQRECMQVGSTCESGTVVVGNAVAAAITESNRHDQCGDREQDCLVTCPGAVELYATSADEAREKFRPSPYLPSPSVVGAPEDFAYARRDAGSP